jgi:CRISPR/Cas system-associated protein Cas7 (RAMP superfamily)
MKERIKGYLEYKLDLELCGVNTFEKDDKIRERYEQYIKDQQQANNDIPTSDTNKATKTTDSTDLLEYKKGKKV